MLRQVSGYEVYGFIGMPFLQKHVFQVDFDTGEVLALKAPGRDCGQGFVVTCNGYGVPRLSVYIAEDYKQEFVLDTGYGGATGSLVTKSFDGVLNKGALKVVGTSYFESISGTTSMRVGHLKHLSLGDFTLPGAIFGEGAYNLLGLGFCSHFVMTLDFANNKVYLKRGKSFDRLETYDLSGLALLRKDGNTVVYSVDKGSAAEAAGIKAGDLLVRVDDVKADMLSMFQLRQRLSTKTKAIRVTIRAREIEREVVVVLALSGVK
jgi:hypothetical protein